MANLETINIGLVGIGHILLNKNMCVPLYQRSYAWEDSHVSEFFGDIRQATSEGANEYFIGSIVTTKNKTDRPEVADGQQRLATATILLAAIRDHFFNYRDLERASTITSDLLHKKDLKTLELIPKLKLNDADNDFFVKRILLNPDDSDRAQTPTKPSHLRIQKAAELAQDFVASIASTSDPTNRLTDLVSYLKDSVVVIWVQVPDDTNAFTIFETLNDRGLSLAISDLLKNYLFGLAGNRLPEAQHAWTSIISTLESISDEDSTVTFIRHFWSSQQGLVREKELYSSIKKLVNTKTKAIAFVKELEKNAHLYAAIINTTDSLWSKYGETSQGNMRTLNLLRMIQIRPLLLSILDSFRLREARLTIKNMVSWSVRFLIHGGLGGGTLETHYCQAAKEIRNASITTSSQLSKKLKNIIPTNKQFKSSFATARVSKAYLARYYLRALESQNRGDADPGLIPNDNSEVVNLEHVLPQSPSEKWKHISPDEQEFIVKRLGNLALMKKQINREAGNDGFTYKKPFYSKSAFSLTKMMATKRVWNQGTIDARQKHLADLAVKTWPIK